MYIKKSRTDVRLFYCRLLYFQAGALINPLINHQSLNQPEPASPV
jgi:hypothetical protein